MSEFHQVDRLAEAEAAVRRLHGRIQRLEEALREHGQHLPDCCLFDNLSDRCDCGLDAALRDDRHG